MCDFCENEKNLFLTRKSFRDYGKDSSEMKIKENGIVEVIIENGEKINKQIVRIIRRIKINYCPMCGRKLSEETEKPNTDEIIAKLKENLTEGEQKKLDESVKAFSEGVNGLWEVVRKGITDV